MKENEALFVIKPDGLDRVVREKRLTQLIEGLFAATGLTRISQIDKNLTKEEVFQIYPILKVPDPVYGEGWKERLITHMTSQQIRCYWIKGEQAEEKANIIKRFLRKTLCDQSTEKGKIIENVAHVADTSDFENTFNVFFHK